jgi:hypothetical protein
MSDLIQIDLENIIKSKNPKILNLIPKFIISWMKGFIHQEYINKILLIGEGKTGTDFIEVIFNELNIKLTSQQEALPLDIERRTHFRDYNTNCVSCFDYLRS